MEREGRLENKSDKQLSRLLREEYVRNESEYRKFKYLIPALILIHTFFIFQIKNLQEFPSLSSFSSRETLLGHSFRDHVPQHPGRKGHVMVAPPSPPTTWHPPPLAVPPVPPQEATVIGLWRQND